MWSSAAVEVDASGLDVLCVQRWYIYIYIYAYLGCNECFFELLLPFYHL